MLGRCQVADIIKTQLESIGMVVSINKISDSQYNYYLANKNYQVLLAGVYNGFSPDVGYFYGEGNVANYYNEDVRSILSEVRNITDQKVLEEKYKALINKTKEDCAYIGLYRNMNFLIVNQSVVGNFEPSEFGVFYNFESWNRE